MTRLLLVDDHPLMRKGLAMTLDAEPDFEVVGQAASAEEAIGQFERLEPDVARRLEPYTDDVAGFRATGIDIATEMCQRLLDEGVPALHFYTMNRSKATKEVLGRLGLVTRA